MDDVEGEVDVEVLDFAVVVDVVLEAVGDAACVVRVALSIPPLGGHLV